MVGTKILIVDELNFCTALRAHFERHGCDVLLAHDGVSALELATGARPDVVIMESALPRLDGRQLLTALREKSDVPVLMMTGGDASERVSLLEAGADDVLAKPFDVRELAARVGAVCRRVYEGRNRSRGDVIRFDNFEISRDRFELKLRGEKVEIPPKELQLLYCLASNPNRVFSREHLLEHVWDFAFLGNSRTVDVHIKRLREKLTGVSDKWALKTVWGVGYKFELMN